MINRDNWKLTKKYQNYRAQFCQVEPETLERDESGLRQLLMWADSTSFFQAHKLLPTFPVYLADAGLKRSSMHRYCVVVRQFFAWLVTEDKRRSKKITADWIKTLRPTSRHKRIQITHDGYTLDEVQAMCAVKSDGSLTLTRAKAAVALLFCSGMRDGALATLPISCVDLDNLTIKQNPGMGVATKYDVEATTYVMDMPILGCARAWDSIVRQELHQEAKWYANVARCGTRLAYTEPGTNRLGVIGSDLRRLCDLASVRYRNPHQLRHGHAAFLLQLCQDMADYKAVSLNMMHSSIMITDMVYSELRNRDVRERIQRMVENATSGHDLG